MTDLAELSAIVDRMHRGRCTAGCIEAVMCDRCKSYRSIEARTQLKCRLFDIAPELLAVAEVAEVVRDKIASDDHEAVMQTERMLCECVDVLLAKLVKLEGLS